MKREYRMYGLVPYNLSPIQQGIQFGHAVVEYGLEFSEDVEYMQWARKDKTFIILNGGTTNLNTPGTLNCHEMRLYANEYKHANFHEPDLGDQLTAVVFLVDDRVWDKENWPDFKISDHDEIAVKFGHSIYSTLEERIKALPSYNEWKHKFSQSDLEANKIIWMREFLKQFRLA